MLPRLAASLLALVYSLFIRYGVWVRKPTTSEQLYIDFDGHCQVDVERTGSAADGAMMQPSDSDTRHLPPDPKGSRAQQAMVDGSQEVTTDTKQIQHDAVHRQEPLRTQQR